MIPDFQSRRYEEEWMDQPGVPQAELQQALAEIRWVNRNLGGTRALLDEVALLLQEAPRRTVRVLDLGTGSADIPLALAEWGQHAGMALDITGIDLNPVAVAESRTLCRAFPNIHIEQGDALQTRYADGAFDIVVSSLFMHHLDDEQAVRLLREMDRLSARGFVVNDLERHPWAWLGITLIGALTGKGRIFRNDAPLSVLRGFTPDEAEAFTRQAGVRDARVSRRSPYRLVITRQKP